MLGGVRVWGFLVLCSCEYWPSLGRYSCVVVFQWRARRKHSCFSGWMFGGMIENCHRFEVQSLKWDTLPPSGLSTGELYPSEGMKGLLCGSALPLHWVNAVLEIAPVSVRRREETLLVNMYVQFAWSLPCGPLLTSICCTCTCRWWWKF